LIRPSIPAPNLTVLTSLLERDADLLSLAPDGAAEPR
jgi:hypothetical protein